MYSLLLVAKPAIRMKFIPNNALISICLLIGGLLTSPATKSIVGLGVDLSNSTEAVNIYFWFISIFLLLSSVFVASKKVRFANAVIKMALLIMIAFACIEFSSSLAFKFLYGSWCHTYYANPNQHIFESHPYLIGTLRKNAQYEREGLKYSHNSQGYRGEEFPKTKSKGKIRIVTVGGSTTYGVGVNNEETWPHKLAESLGQGYEVLNLGVPGYTTAENLIQTGLHLSEFDADIAIYFVGLNDMRNFNIHDLQSDYSDYHAPSLYSALGLCGTENVASLASLRMTLIMLQKFGLVEKCPNQSIRITQNHHTGTDSRALALYERNLNSIVAICESQDVKVIFVPHVLLEEVLKTGDYKWWIPFIPTSEVDDMMAVYNSTLKGVADANNIRFADSVLTHEWKTEDFVDMSHFNTTANQRFAKILESYILSSNSPADSTKKVTN